MPTFEIADGKLTRVPQDNFALEKDLQILIESNLIEVFNCRFVASEFSTGSQHAGRIDTLALSEEDHPVIIEYKKVESSQLINQSLFYLHWIQDHRGDFEIVARKSLGYDVNVDWSFVRVICIAPNYSKYDLHAVQVMGANIELWKYRRFKNSILYLEDIFQKSKFVETKQLSEKDPKMVQAGKKAAETRATGIYSFSEHIDNKPQHICELVYQVQEFILGLDPSIEEVPKKFYIAYKATQNIVCMEVKTKAVKLFVKLNPNDIETPPFNLRDVSKIGHYGTGDAEFTVKSADDMELVKPYIEQAYNELG